MAQVIFSSIVDAVSGRIGGVVYGRTTQGYAARSYTRPKKAASGKQIAQRSNFVNSYLLWKDLTPEEQQTWNDLAASPPETDYDAFGNIVLLSGYSWFNRCALRAIAVSSQPNRNATEQPRPPTTVGSTLAATTDPIEEVIFHVETDEIPLNSYGILFLSYIGGSSLNTRMRNQLVTYSFYGPSAGDIDITSEFLNIWGNFSAGTSYAWNFYRQSGEHLRSIPESGIVTVT